MKKREAFTLIELLAVILILGIIALIAIPVVTKLIKEARKGSIMSSASSILKATENYMAEMELTGMEISYPYNLDLVGENKLDYKGIRPEQGQVYINENGDISMYIVMNDWCAVKKLTDSEFKTVEKTSEECVLNLPPPVYPNGTVVYFNPRTAEICTGPTEYIPGSGNDSGTNYKYSNSSTGYNSGCLKWYVFNDNMYNTKVNLLLDHNIEGSAKWSESSTANPYIGYYLILAGSYWHESVKPARIISMDEINQITGNTTFDRALNSGYFFDTGTTTAPETYTGTYGWLYDRTNASCTTYGCSNNATGSIDTEAYWTSTSAIDITIAAFGVRYNGRIMYQLSALGGSKYGVRPVITVDKSKL